MKRLISDGYRRESDRKMHRVKRNKVVGKNRLSRSWDYYWAELYLPRPEQRVLEGPYEEADICLSPLISSMVLFDCFFGNITTKCFLQLNSSFSDDKLE